MHTNIMLMPFIPPAIRVEKITEDTKLLPSDITNPKARIADSVKRRPLVKKILRVFLNIDVATFMDMMPNRGIITPVRMEISVAMP